MGCATSTPKTPDGNMKSKEDELGGNGVSEVVEIMDNASWMDEKGEDKDNKPSATKKRRVAKKPWLEGRAQEEQAKQAKDMKGSADGSWAQQNTVNKILGNAVSTLPTTKEEDVKQRRCSDDSNITTTTKKTKGLNKRSNSGGGPDGKALKRSNSMRLIQSRSEFGGFKPLPNPAGDSTHKRKRSTDDTVTTLRMDFNIGSVMRDTTPTGKNANKLNSFDRGERGLPGGVSPRGKALTSVSPSNGKLPPLKAMPRLPPLGAPGPPPPRRSSRHM